MSLKPPESKTSDQPINGDHDPTEEHSGTHHQPISEGNSIAGDSGNESDDDVIPKDANIKEIKYVVF